MKILQRRFIFSTMILYFANFSFCNVEAQISPQPQQKPPELFSGYTESLVQAPDVSPYGVVTGQNVIPLVVGYGLLTQPPLSGNDAYNAPYEPVASSPNDDMPTIAANTSTQFLLGKMLQTHISENELKGYSDSIAQALTTMDTAALTPVSSSSSYNSVANVNDSNAFTVSINQTFANPYDSKSLFDYVSPKSSGNTKTNPAEIYISLVSGALTPVAIPSPQSEDFGVQVRRLAAIQTAGVNALQQIFDRSKPVLNDNDADNMKNILHTLGDSSITESPTTKRDFEQVMATHRLDPNNSWYAHLQQANPVELQRQALYLQAEMLYELYQIRKEEEQNKMLLAVNLLAQNYQTRSALNFQSKASPAAIKSLTASAMGTATGSGS